MKRLSFFVCLAVLLLLVPIGVTAADPADTTATTATTAAITTTSERTGGSIYFETDPPDASIWLATVEIGTSPLTYYSEKTGTLNVHIQKRGYEDSTDTVTVIDGKRVTFFAKLTPVSYDITDTNTPVVPTTTATIIRRSTITIPTPWPTSAPASPVDPAVVLGAAALGTGFFVIRRR